MIAEIIYGLCALLSTAIAVMLWRQHLRGSTRLIFWTAWCFSGLALSNVLLIIDKIVVPDTDLSPLRHVVSLLSICLLLIGLVYEDE